MEAVRKRYCTPLDQAESRKSLILQGDWMIISECFPTSLTTYPLDSLGLAPKSSAVLLAVENGNCHAHKGNCNDFIHQHEHPQSRQGTDLQDPTTSLGSWGLGDFNDDKRRRMCAVGRWCPKKEAEPRQYSISLAWEHTQPCQHYAARCFRVTTDYILSMGRDRLAKSAIARRTEPSPRSPWSWARARLGPYASGSPCFSAPRTLVANSALPDKAHKMMRAMYPAGRSSLGRPTLDEVQKISIIYEQTSWILLDCLGDATFKASDHFWGHGTCGNEYKHPWPVGLLAYYLNIH